MKMKKWIAFVLLGAMLLSLAACKGGENKDPQPTDGNRTEPVETTTGKEEPTETTEEPTETTEEPVEITEEPSETTAEPTETEPAVEEFWQEENLTYPLTFAFSSGAGGWGTELYLNEDGTFTGEFRDSNMGDNGEGYPNGTVLTCRFAGRFAPTERLDMYTYSTKLVELTTEKAEGEEWIEDGIRFVASYPYGLDGGEDFRIYLPNTPVSMLSEDAYLWWPGRYDEEPSPTIRAYCLGNVANDQCFFTEMSANIEYPMAFYFSSGAGAWATELQLNEDGTFTGYFWDTNMGENGEGYPYGTTYVCSFSGNSALRKRWMTIPTGSSWRS